MPMQVLLIELFERCICVTVCVRFVKARTCIACAWRCGRVCDSGDWQREWRDAMRNARCARVDFNASILVRVAYGVCWLVWQVLVMFPLLFFHLLVVISSCCCLFIITCHQIVV